MYYGYKTDVYGVLFLGNFFETVSFLSGLQHVVFVDEIPAVPKQSYTKFYHLRHLLRGVRTAALRVTLPGSDGHCVSLSMKNQDGTKSSGSIGRREGVLLKKIKMATEDSRTDFMFLGPSTLS